MNFNDRLYVEIVPLESGTVPHPHPIDEGRCDPALVYKVLGVYNPSETSECYLMLANPQREIWFIPQRHVRAYKLIDSDEFFLPKHIAGDNGNGHHHHRRRAAAAAGIAGQRRNPRPPTPTDG